MLTSGKKITRDLFWQNDQEAAFRRGVWKYLRTKKGREMLYDLENDPTEKENLSAADRETLEELRKAHEKIAATFADDASGAR